MPFNRPIPDRKPMSKPSQGMAAVIQAETLIQIAFVLPSAAVIGWLGGAFLDSKLHQNWIGIFGLVFGFVAGMVYVIRLAFSAEKRGRPGIRPDNGAEGETPNRKS
jgi:F0F1-type ATP synthase assembly protein I